MPHIVLETAVDRLTFDGDTGRLTLLRPKALPELELIATVPDCPAFVLQYLTDAGEYRRADSHGASQTDITCEETDAGQTLSLCYGGVGAMDVDVVITIRTAPEDAFSRWSCKVRNGAGIRLTDVQFPVLIVPDEGTVLQAVGDRNHLTSGKALQALPADEPAAWEFRVENKGGSTHYPGHDFAQFLAWYNDDATGSSAAGRGVYAACEDTEGNIKRFHALRREPGIRLGIAHIGDWPAPGERTLEYDVVVRSFEGDWYDAADIYRNWTLAQKWATTLTERTDVPESLLDSPPHITIRVQGYIDEGPARPIEEFLPYEKSIPLLEEIARRVESSLVPIVMSWERAGPWIYPDCFPPIAGDEALARFIAMAKERGWRVGLLANGTRWVTEHFAMDYDGRKDFEERDGADSVCRLPDGEMWSTDWDTDWRPSYLGCAAQPMTKDIATDAMKRIVGWGMESIQFFDQNFGCATFPCFAPDHGHPPMPGKWMATAMEQIIGAFGRVAEEAGAADAYQSVECACNEYCLPLFPQCDERISPPSSGRDGYIPLYHYLFHECIIINGMMSTGSEPFKVPISTAWNCVWGEIPGAVITGDGTLLNRETFNWAEWEPKIGNNDDALEMIRTVTAMRRGPGRDFLLYGRMQRPGEVNAEVMSWEHNDRTHEVPAVADAAWQAPDGRFAIILANWTTETQSVAIVDSRLGDRVTVNICGPEQEQATHSVTDGNLTVSVPRLSCALVEKP